MNKTHIRLKFVRHALRVVLCYVIVLQAFLAANSTAFAVSQAGGAAAGFVICHNVGDDTPLGPDSRTPAGVPCALCAMAASSNGLPPDPSLAVVAPPTVAQLVRPLGIVIVASSPPARAGLARAPPQFT